MRRGARRRDARALPAILNQRGRNEALGKRSVRTLPVAVLDAVRRQLEQEDAEERHLFRGGARMKRKNFHASFQQRGKWWIAWTDDLPGALTQGKTLEEARENLKDAIAMMLEPADLDRIRKPKSRVVREVISV
jgi:predicted RNase H-like HicB family nuclease